MSDQGPVLTLAVVAFQAIWPHWVIGRLYENGIAVDRHVHGDFRATWTQNCPKYSLSVTFIASAIHRTQSRGR
eukprot:6113786-Amphidinium_carterae.1